MDRSLFVTELKNPIDSDKFSFLRLLYTPIIGVRAVALFSILYDYNLISKNNKTYYSFKEISKILNCNEEELILERKKLEAVGLLTVFEKADNVHFIFILNTPLTPEKFKLNSLLYKEAVSKIGEIVFERILFFNKPNKFSKDEFHDVTTKYQDMFSIVDSKNNIVDTQTIALNAPETVEDAIKGLNPQQFIFYLTNKKLSPSQLGAVQRVTNYGFSSQTTNTIIEYTFNSNNGAIVAKYIETIAKDLHDKNIFILPEVKKELEKALISKKDKNNIDPIVKVKNTVEESDKTWDDLFSSLGGL